MEASADNTEYCVLRLLYSIESAIIADGKNLHMKEIQLMRLADSATNTYAMVSALARASRWVCAPNDT